MTAAFMCLIFYWIFGIAMNISATCFTVLMSFEKNLPLCVITISILMVSPFAHTFFYLLQIQGEMKLYIGV